MIGMCWKFILCGDRRFTTRWIYSQLWNDLPKYNRWFI